MKHIKYNTDLKVVEIERVSEISLSVVPKDIWYWEILICTHGSVTKGKAYEPSRNAVVPWANLKSMQPLEEMIEACKKYMGL